MGCNGTWLTGDVLGVTPDICFKLPVPSDVYLRSALRGALYELTQEKAWEQHNGLNAQQCASFFASIFYENVITPVECTSVGASMLVGEVKLWASQNLPNGFLWCNGDELFVADYPELFAEIGYTWGGEDDTFFLPDLRGRVPVGAGQGEAPALTPRYLGERLGSETHTLSVNEMPAHTHTLQNKSTAGTLGATVATGGSTLVGTRVTGSSGGNQSHNNMQPSLVLNYIIRALP